MFKNTKENITGKALQLIHNSSNEDKLKSMKYS